MSSTYSTNLALELTGTGEQAGNWGATNNLNIGTLLEQAISGYVTQNMPGTDVTLTMSNGASATARNMFIELTGTGGANLIVPANKKLYFIYNNASSSVVVKVSGQTGLSVPVGAKYLMVCNGTDVIGAVNHVGSLTAASPIGIASGGTGTASIPTGVLYGNGTSAITAATAAQVVSTISTTAVTNATNATNITNSGGWSVTPSGSKLYFNYAGTNVASLDSSGNLVTLANITAYGTP